MRFSHLGASGVASPGFRNGEIHDGSIVGHFPYSPILIRVTSVTTTTTVFRATGLLELGAGVGAQDLTDLFITRWRIMGVQCSNAANEGTLVNITGYNELTTEFTTSAMPSSYVIGDTLALMPEWTVSDIWNYINLAPGSLAAGGAGAAWRDAAFNRILAVTGLCRVKLTIRVATTFTGAGNIQLGTVDDGDAFATDQVFATTLIVNRLWTPSGAGNARQVTNDNGTFDFIVNGTNIGWTLSTSPTAGALVVNAWWQGLEAGAFVAVGAGEAT